MKEPPELSVVVPVFNEEQVLPETAPKIVEFCLSHNWQLVFVDDGSSDQSGAFLDGLGRDPEIRVLHHKVNRGYGRAIKTGIRNADAPFLATIDSDGQHEVSDLAKIFEFAVSKDADLVVGNRGTKGNEDPYRALGKRIIRGFTRLLMPLPIEDLNSGFKIYRTNLAKRYQLVCPDTMSFSDVITLVFIHKGCLVLEHPIQVNPRKAGRSTINTYTAVQTILEILNIVLLFDPLRIFLPLSLLLVLAGLLWGTIIYMLMHRGLSVAAMLSIVTGLIFFILGLLANQISSMRMERLEE